MRHSLLDVKRRGPHPPENSAPAPSLWRGRRGRHIGATRFFFVILRAGPAAPPHVRMTAGPRDLAWTWAGACPRQRDRRHGRETPASGATEDTGSHAGLPLRGTGSNHGRRSSVGDGRDESRPYGHLCGPHRAEATAIPQIQRPQQLPTRLWRTPPERPTLRPPSKQSRLHRAPPHLRRAGAHSPRRQTRGGAGPAVPHARKPSGNPRNGKPGESR
jgi:hypothetical protein